MRQLKLTLLFLVINFSGLALGNLFMNQGPQSDWYINLNKASWTPAGWVFGFSWTTIMVCFSIYLGKLFSNSNFSNKHTITFIVQFILNVSWNFLFFNQHFIFLSLLNLIFLIVVIFYFYFDLSNQIKNYKYLLIPYIIWLCIATSLNLYIFIKN